jgi:putative PIN family toxin of toxin-antitoxin system
VRATVDSNIWVSAVISRHGSPARLEAAFRAGCFTAVTSDPLLDEVEGVLLRPRLAARFAVTPEKVAAILTLPRDRAESVGITGTVRVCRDPEDDAVIETAIRGKADVIVTGDADLRDDPAVAQFLREHGIEVWTVRQFIEWLERQEQSGV